MPALEGMCGPKLRRFPELDTALRVDSLPIMQGFVMPSLRSSELCPTREDVFNTPATVRWKLWEDKGCSESCTLRWC